MSTTAEIQTTPATALIRQGILDGSITLADILRKVEAAKPASAPAERRPVPLPKVITRAQQEALATLPSVYGKVTPDESRILTSEEIKALYVERKTLDQAAKLAKARTEDIRTIVLNHLDEINEDRAEEFDKDGHVLIADTVAVPGENEVFSWEIREGSPSLSAESLAALDAAGEIDHDLYLSLTDQVRVINEQKVLLALQKNPEVVLDILDRASSAGSKTGAFNVRKAK